jgi:hypothetical protein
MTAEVMPAVGRRGDGVRTDPDTGEQLPTGHLTRRELARWWAQNERAWREWSFAEGPPEPRGWAWTWSVGWTKEKTKR